MPGPRNCELNTQDTLQCLRVCLKAALCSREEEKAIPLLCVPAWLSSWDAGTASPFPRLEPGVLPCPKVKAGLLRSPNLLPLRLGGSTSHPLLSQPRDKNKRHQHPAGWAVTLITPRSCLRPIMSLLCTRLNFPAFFSSLIKHFYQPSLLAGSEFFFFL